MRVAVIGGGPSGVVTLKYLLIAHQSLSCEPVEARLFEYQDTIGGTFAARAYEDAELVSSKQLTTFSDFRSSSSKDFLSATEYVQYLHDYCSHFTLWPHIKLKTRVINVTRRHGGGHIVVYRRGNVTTRWECDALAVCSGLHVEPNIPSIEGIENVPLVLHSSQFRERRQFGRNKTVMVVGCGETGADIAYLAATWKHAGRVLLCHRDGVHFAPKRNPGPVLLPIMGRKPDPNEPGIPIDVSTANMFDTAYVHPILRRNDNLLWDCYHRYIQALLWLSSGTTAGMDQWIGAISPGRHHPSKIFFNKSNKVCPFISAPYRPNLPGPALWMFALRSAFIQTPIPDTCGKQVDLAPWPAKIDATGAVNFLDTGRPEFHRLKNDSIRPDMIVLCTGYKQSFPFFDCSASAAIDNYPTPKDADVRQIWRSNDVTIGFIGFVRPSLGAIPPLAELQAQLWILNLLKPSIGQLVSLRDEGHYRLKHEPGSRVTYGVDHESYAYQLALDMQSAPGIVDILGIVWSNRRGQIWRLPIIWAFGAHFNTKFRLQGPWKWDQACNCLTEGEFWETITRRPVIFGSVPAPQSVAVCL